MKKILWCLLLLCMCNAAMGQEDTAYKFGIYRAINLYHAQQYKASAKAFTKAFIKRKGGFTEDRYTAACSWALAGYKDSAYNQLIHIATKGHFTDIDMLLADDDLESLHKDARWEKLCGMVRKNKEKMDALNNKK